MLFVSHATPEDNEFARWLSLQLAKEGYPVWCDLTKLLGGEPFWKEIETAIRDRTIKFLFVLSKHSNQKEGTLNELSVASTLRSRLNDDHFIIPLRIDDLPFGDINISLHKLNAIDFSKGWITGFKQLIERLTEDQISTDPRFNIDSVATWWRANYDANEGVSQSVEPYCSNRISLKGLPSTLFIYTLDKTVPEDINLYDFPYPVTVLKNHLLSFSPFPDIFPILERLGISLEHTEKSSTATVIENGYHKLFDSLTARNHIQFLLKQACHKLCLSKGLRKYELSNKRSYFWFPSNLLKDDKIEYLPLVGKKTWKAVVGFKTVKAQPTSVKIRNWHFGIECLPTIGIENYLTIIPHVVFTEEGAVIDSVKKQHSYRRSQCKGWYNNDWRDRILASLSYLASGQQDLIINLGDNVSASASSIPLTYESPVSYIRTVDLPSVDENADSIDDDEESDDEESEDL